MLITYSKIQIMRLFFIWANKDLNLISIIMTAILGFVYAIQLLVYIILFSKEDASNIVAINFSYPIIVAILAFIFLKENIGYVGYFSIMLLLVGVYFIEKRMKSLKSQAPSYLLISMVLITGLYEFLIKIGVMNIDTFTATCLNSMFAGLFLLGLLARRKIRNNFKKEIKNWKFASFNESLTFLGLYFLFLAMSLAPATIVAGVTVIQPLIVLIGEFVILKRIKKTVRDGSLKHKLFGICLIVIGLLLLITKLS